MSLLRNAGKCTPAIIFWFIAAGFAAAATIDIESAAIFTDTDSPYRIELKQIREAADKGLPQTAAEAANRLYAKAAKDKNHANIAVAAYFRAYFGSRNSSQPDSALISMMERERRTASTAPAIAIITSLTAKTYADYSAMYRRQMFGRNACDVNTSDFTAWDISLFNKKIAELYNQSLEPSTALQAIPLQAIRDAISFPVLDSVGRDTSSILRPTLYDVLANRAIGYFSLRDNSDIRPLPDSLSALTFAPQKEFSRAFSADNRDYALRIFAELLRFHAADATPDALLDAELNRMEYAKSLWPSNRADTLYKSALERIITEHPAAPAAATFFYALAEWYNEHDNGTMAMQLCETAIGKYPQSNGAALCKMLKNQLLMRTLDITVEPDIRPGKPALFSINYAQISKLYLRLIRIPCADLLSGDSDNNRFSGNALILQAATAPIEHEWQEALPASPNYRPYTAQSSMPPLSAGRYILLASAKSDFQTDDSGAVRAISFIVSSLSVFNQKFNGNDEISGWNIVDLENGWPQADVKVRFFAVKHSNRQDNVESRGESVSNTDGFIPQSAAKLNNDDYSVLLLATKGTDTLITSANVYNWRRQHSEPSVITYIYSGRKLYRPGQTVQFKGIAVRSDYEKRKFTAAKNENITVVISDPNGTRISEMQVLTNEFGSYSGTFALPRASAKGFWNISDGYGATMIQVEEYKRPKFSVTLTSPEGAVTLGKVITVRGNVVAFAGNAISDGKVRYRITRNVRFNIWKHGIFHKPVSETLITEGNTTTDKNGSFPVKFTAEPDFTADSNAAPVFIFTITADITDAAGETHTASLDISAGYTSVVLSIEAPQEVKANTPFTISLFGKNLNGQPVVIAGSVTLEEIPPAKHFYRQSALPVPDAILIAPEDFVRNFPEDLPETTNKNFENNLQPPQPPPLQKSLVNMPFNIANGTDSLRIAALKPGKYSITGIGFDHSGRALNVEHIFMVYDISQNGGKTELPDPKPLVAFAEQKTAQPGQTVRFAVGSGYTDARILFMAEKDGNILRREWLSVSEELRAVDIPIGEEMRGGFSATVFMTRSGRTYQERINVQIPWTDKKLHISASVLRDKTRPGAKEEWKFTVKGEKSEKVAAEFLATMYDASLDAITGNEEKTGWAEKMFPWPISAPQLYLSSLPDIRKESSTSGSYWNIIGNFNLRRDYPRLFQEYETYRGGRMARKTMQAESSDRAYRADASLAMSAAPEGNANGKEVTYPVNSSIQPRVNLRETAFFYPRIYANDSDEYVFSFTMPEALTTWRFMAMAHTADLRVGELEREIITQKDLMVLPNMPRFLREGDTLVLPATIANLADRNLNGTARLELFDAETMKPINMQFGLNDGKQNFYIENKSKTVVSWRISIPSGIDAAILRITAAAGDFSDGEESILPVLPASAPIIETLPVMIRGNGERTFTLKNLANLAGKPSSALKSRKLTFEFTENPVWHAVQALPMLMEYPYECAEQLFNRYAANALAERILRAQPKIAATVRRWTEGGNLVSQLAKNESLKAITLNETPWAAEGKSETERKQRIARLLDENSMRAERESAIRKLRELQLPSGGFPWFAGMNENRTITQYILAGIARIIALDAAGSSKNEITDIATAAIIYADKQIGEEFARLKNDKKFNPKNSGYNFTAAQYLYARSFFPDIKPNKAADSALQFYRNQAVKFWQKQDIQTQVLTASALWRFAEYDAENGRRTYDATDSKTAQNIIASLRERAVRSKELGMYWTMPSGLAWQDAPIETQALLIETFELLGAPESDIEDMRYWLIRNKQTHDWRTTKATAEACYALLLRGKNQPENRNEVTAVVGGKRIVPESREAGTGYYSVSWSGSEITPAMATIELTGKGDGVSYGGLYWQYNENIKSVREQKSAISVERTTIIKQPRTNNKAYVGSRATIRLVIRTDRDMEYVHIKDMRPTCFEPVIQTSGYEWLGNTGYYRSPADASTNFFAEWLPRGTTVIEYDVFAAYEGSFADGIAAVQSLYAPEFTAHSRGGTIRIEK